MKLKIEKIQGSANKTLIKLIAKGGIIVFIGSMIGRALRFIFYIILIRVLGASVYGLYSIGQSLVDIATNIGLLGDGRGMIRFAAGYVYNKDAPRIKGIILSYLYTSFFISLAMAVLIFISAKTLSTYIIHDQSLAWVFKLFSIALPFYIFSLTCVPIGYAFHKIKYKVIMQEIFQPVSGIITIIIIFAIGAKLYGAITGFIISSILSALLCCYLIKNVFPEIVSKAPLIMQVKKLLFYSFPIMGVTFCYYLLFRLDKIMLGAFTSSYDVGIYSAASNTAMFMITFSTIFEPSILPIISQLYHNNENKELERVFSCVTFWGISLMFIPCLVLIIFNQEILSLFGTDFKAGGWALIILCLSLLIETIPGQIRQLLQMSSRQTLELINSIAIVVVNISLNLILIPHLGIFGAALAVFFSLLFISIVRLIETNIIFGFNTFTLKYIKFIVFIICAVAIGILSSLNKSISVKIFSVITITSAYIWLAFKNKSEEDILIWNSIRSKLKFKYE